MRRLAALLLFTVAACGGQTAGTPVAGPSTGAPASSTSAAAKSTTATAKPTSTTTKPPAQSTGNDVLGPDGWGPVKIGMDIAQATATGVFADTPPATDTCAQWPTPLAAPIESAIISPHIGVAAIVARTDGDKSRLHTPEGIGIGSTAEEVHAAYPSSFDVDDVETPNGPTIPVPGNADAAYRLSFNSDAKVTYLVLESASQDCYA